MYLLDLASRYEDTVGNGRRMQWNDKENREGDFATYERASWLQMKALRSPRGATLLVL